MFANIETKIQKPKRTNADNTTTTKETHAEYPFTSLNVCKELTQVHTTINAMKNVVTWYV